MDVAAEKCQSAIFRRKDALQEVKKNQAGSQIRLGRKPIRLGRASGLVTVAGRFKRRVEIDTLPRAGTARPRSLGGELNLLLAKE
jgi:hypothetical protein